MSDIRAHRASQLAFVSAKVLTVGSIIMLAMTLANPLAAQDVGQIVEPAIVYPAAAREDIVDEMFGTSVGDPYRWLEADVGNAPRVAEWVAAQREITEAYLSDLEQRQFFEDRLRDRYDYDQVTVPRQAGERLFYTLNDGSSNFPRLLVRKGGGGPDRVLIDPDTWSDDSTKTLAEWAPSSDGALLAYAVQDRGSDLRTIKVMDVETGSVLSDEVARARFTRIVWAPNNAGFFYSRAAEPEDGATEHASVTGHAVYYHAIGMDQRDDLLVYDTPDEPTQYNAVSDSQDGRYLYIYSSSDLARWSVLVADLAASDWEMRLLAEAGKDLWSVLANRGTTQLMFTTQDAPNGKMVTFDLADPDAGFKDLVPESSEGILQHAHRVGDRLFVVYSVDVKSEVEIFDLEGNRLGAVPLPEMGTVTRLSGDPDGAALFLEYESFDTPATIYKYDFASNESTIWFEPRELAGEERVIEQHFATSADGTRVPLFTIRRKDVTKAAPTLLLGYGGYGVSMFPDYSASLMAWVDLGGVAAVANIRGGSEYGAAWHEAARGLNRQNAFDDFISAGEFLKQEGITSPDGLAIYGDSNGGTLVGVVTNQRPDLVDVALPGVGVMDMIRYPLFTGGAYWMGEFGNPAVEEHFENLIGYSPYHNIAEGVDYPAVMATTSETDVRVIPSHTFKYVAALQAAEIGDKPRLVRIAGPTGHGNNISRDRVIAQLVDVWAFAAHWTGLEVER